MSNEKTTSLTPMQTKLIELTNRMQAVANLRAVLINTPADKTGMVEGTPFSKAGVSRLMDLLAERAGDTSKPGSNVAKRLRELLVSQEPGEEVVAGASAKRLRRLAMVISRLEDRLEKVRNI